MKNYCFPLSHQVYTAEQVRELDRRAIESGISGFSLMTLAGQFMFDSIRQSSPDAKSMLVFCGIGNNAGDGYIIASLALAAGLAVRVVQLGKSLTPLQGDALQAQQLYFASGGKNEYFNPDSHYSAEVIVDALFGTGLKRPVKGIWAQAITAINANHGKKKIAAVDIPSGLNANTGIAMGCAVIADMTVTFIARKQGLYTGQARDYIGQLFFSSLGVSKQFSKRLPQITKKVFLLATPSTLALPPRKATAHKNNHGHVLLIGGASGMGGAIKMAAEAALTVGAGLVTVITHPEHAPFLNLNRPELMVKGVLSADELSPYLQRANVIAIGPGLGIELWGQALFNACLTTAHDKIIDADGLNLLAKQPVSRNNWILTPHAGEAARLLGITPQEIEADRYTAILKMQQNYSGYCVLKGAGTLIADQEQISISTLGNAGMAVAGMGDVLTGIIAGLRAQKMSLKMAARVGVTLHAMAADRVAKKKGQRGIFATDLYPYLQKLVN